MPESQIVYIETADGKPLRLTPMPTITVSSTLSDCYGVALEQWRLPPMELPENATTQHLLTLKLSAPSRLEWKSGAHFQSRCLAPGDVCLAPAGQPRQLRWQEEIEILALALDPALVARIARETVETRRIELLETHGDPDPQVQYIGLALRAELESGSPGGRLFAESLATALAVHLLGRYNAFPSMTREPVGGLSPTRLRRAVEYIEDNLDDDLSLPEMAAALDMSVSRFKSLFKQSTGLAPHRYVIQQRVERARRLLLRGDLNPAQVALQVGFYDQSHLTRHFKRLIGVTPGMFLNRK